MATETKKKKKDSSGLSAIRALGYKTQADDRSIDNKFTQTVDQVAGKPGEFPDWMSYAAPVSKLGLLSRVPGPLRALVGLTAAGSQLQPEVQAAIVPEQAPTTDPRFSEGLGSQGLGLLEMSPDINTLSRQQGEITDEQLAAVLANAGAIDPRKAQGVTQVPISPDEMMEAYEGNYAQPDLSSVYSPEQEAQLQALVADRPDAQMPWEEQEQAASGKKPGMFKRIGNWFTEAATNQGTLDPTRSKRLQLDLAMQQEAYNLMKKGYDPQELERLGLLKQDRQTAQGIQTIPMEQQARTGVDQPTAYRLSQGQEYGKFQNEQAQLQAKSRAQAIIEALRGKQDFVQQYPDLVGREGVRENIGVDVSDEGLQNVAESRKKKDGMAETLMLLQALQNGNFGRKTDERGNPLLNLPR